MSSPTATLDVWLEEHPELCRRVLIPAALKWEIRDKLDQANVNERVLFPGLDGLSRWLARYYMPTAPGANDALPQPDAQLPELRKRTPRKRARVALKRRTVR